MATVEITVWVNEDGEVFSKKMLDEFIDERVKDAMNSGESFDDFICEDFSAFDLFKMNEGARAKVWKDYEAQVRKWVSEEVDDWFREQTIEIDIDISN